MNAITKYAAPTNSALVPSDLDQAIRLAEAMSRGKLVPVHLQGSPGDCLMVVEQATRWRMSPFAVAQCTSVIKGKLMFEGKLVAAAVETSGALATLFDYQFKGEGENRTITVSAVRVGESAPRTIEVRLKDVVTENGIWKKQPDQQLVYHGSRVWARRWTPAVLLGVYSPEEFGREEFTGTTINATAEPATSPIREEPLTPFDARDPIDVLRDRADNVIKTLALQDTLERVEKAEKMTRGLLADIDKTEGAGEIKRSVLDAFIAARKRVNPQETTLAGTELPE